MTPERISHLLFGGLAVGLLLSSVAEASICFMAYQIADSNLQPYLLQNFLDLSQSRAVASADFKTWIYFDSDTGTPPPGLLDANGVAVSSTFTGSRYITYDRSLGAMKIDTQLSGEQNSDSPDVIQAFLEHALADCVANDYTSFMAVFSSHGGGLAGFGEDDHKRRQLMQTNHKIVQAIRGALNNTAGAPSKLDVLGFDACSMQALGAADDYSEVAKYIVASEAVEPGHGWAYAFLTKTDTALSLAQQIVSTFVEQAQGGSQKTPKTLAVLDTDLFATFVTAFDGFFAQLNGTIWNDQTLLAYVARTHASTTSFVSAVDTGGGEPSGLDIGSFLTTLQGLCQPGADLGTALSAATTAYNNMFVVASVGPGTAPATGMHFVWPSQKAYKANTHFWDAILFERAAYVTAIAPNLLSFLQYYLASSEPDVKPSSPVATTRAGDAASICFSNASPSAKPDKPDGLLYNSTIDIQQTSVTVSTGIGVSVSYVEFEYGLDLTTPLKSMLEEKGYTATPEDSLYLQGGDVLGTYRDSEFFAAWNRDFYFLNITGASSYEALYAIDNGGGSKSVPVLYFPESQREAVSKLQFLDFLFFDFKYWTGVGAKYGFLSFSVSKGTREVNDNLSLFTSVSEQQGFQETPRSSQGLMIPLVYVKGFIHGRSIDRLPGGFNQTIINWREDIDYNIIAVRDERIFLTVPDADAVVVSLRGYDFSNGQNPPENKTFDIIRPAKGGAAGGQEQSTGQDNGFSGSSASQVRHAGSFMVICFLYALI